MFKLFKLTANISVSSNFIFRVCCCLNESGLEKEGQASLDFEGILDHLQKVSFFWQITILFFEQKLVFQYNVKNQRTFWFTLNDFSFQNR